MIYTLTYVLTIWSLFSVPAVNNPTEQLETPAERHYVADCADAEHDCIYWAANKDCICKWTDGDCSWQTHVAKTCPKSCGLCHAKKREDEEAHNG